MIWLKLSLLVAFLFSLSYFILYFSKIYHYYRPRAQAKPRGEIKRGKIYALTIGLLPWEKESTRRNWLIYITGIVYHLSISVAFFRLLALLLNWRLLSGQSTFFFLVVGTGCGLGLFFRRLMRVELRQLSLPDDYLANLLVDLFLLTGATSILWPGAVISFLLSGLILILYLPLGKIRHCVFFVPSRLIFGHYFGLRAVLPPPGRFTWRTSLK